MSRLAIDATTGVTDLVEAMHRTIGGGPSWLGRPFALPTQLFTSPVYASIRNIARLVGAGVDLALAEFAKLIDERAPPAEQEAVLAALNGVLGDYLAVNRNPLAIRMHLRRDRVPLAEDPVELAAQVPGATSRVVVFIHGCCMTDAQWNRTGHDHSVALERDRDITAVHVFYNSGLHISHNGRALGPLLEDLVRRWPVPVEELSLVGHSMGGLVARSACHYGETSGESWRGLVRRLVCLGSPHHGAVLERGGNWADVLLGISPYSAPFARLSRIRSAGVTDLRYGNVVDEHWAGRDRFALHGDQREELSLPAGVATYLVAGTLSEQLSPRLRSDGLVSVDSALGRHHSPKLMLDVPEAHGAVFYGTGHLALLSSPAVYEALSRWFS